MSKAGLTLNDLYDTTCMTHNRFSNFHCVCTIIQVAHTQFIKVVLTEYSAFKSSRKMIQKQAAEAVLIALISEKNKSKKKDKERRICVKPQFKRRKNLEYYETLLPELQLEDEYNYNILLRMTSKNFGEIFQLIKDDFLSTGVLYKTSIHEYYSSYSTMNNLTFTSFRAFVFYIFFCLIKKTNHLI